VLAGATATSRDLRLRSREDRWCYLVDDLTPLSELDGAKVVLEIDGESHTLSDSPAPVGADDPAPARPTREPRLLISTTFENAVALACGRADADPAKVSVIGDRALYEALAARLGFTP
jgi:hypothetical protein